MSVAVAVTVAVVVAVLIARMTALVAKADVAALWWVGAVGLARRRWQRWQLGGGGDGSSLAVVAAAGAERWR